MKTILSLVIIIVATWFAGCGTAPEHGTSDVAAIVSCSNPGMRFRGTIVADGHTKQVSGTGGRTFYLTGNELAFSFKKEVSEGSISLTVAKAGQCVASATAGSHLSGVRGHMSLREDVVVQQGASSF